MSNKIVTIHSNLIDNLVVENSTPFYIYDEKLIRESIRSLKKIFEWNLGFREFFPVKANPNPAILDIFVSEGCGLDCASLTELGIAESLKIDGDNLILSIPNGIKKNDFSKASKLKLIVNLDDINHLNILEEINYVPEVLSIRYNPGNTSIFQFFGWGDFRDQKFGVTKRQLFKGYEIAKDRGVRKFGLHLMVISNDKNERHFLKAFDTCLKIVSEIKDKLGIEIDFVDLGGGLGVDYHPSERKLDIQKISKKMESKYMKMLSAHRIRPFKIYLELGRYLLASHGYLISTVLQVKHTYRSYAALDASMVNLMRPGMYGSYHHISPLKIRNSEKYIYDVVGSLCENNDKFAINRELPELCPGDIVVIHDVGAYGRSKVFDFNGRLRAAEFLVKPDNSILKIRRSEEFEDYCRTFIKI